MNLTTGTQQAHPVMECPCRQYATVKEIKGTLISDDATERFIHWISGKTEESAASPKRLLSCSTSSSKCSQRVRASVDILNAIRDVCQLYLEKPGSVSTSSASEAKLNARSESYEESFPSLPKSIKSHEGTGNSKTTNARLVRKDHPCDHSKSRNAPTSVAAQPKRRLQPTLITPHAPTLATSLTNNYNSSLKQVPGGFYHGNISCLPSEEHFPMANHVKNVMSSKTQQHGEVTRLVDKPTLTPRAKPSTATATSNLDLKGDSAPAIQKTEATHQQVVRLARMYTTLIRSFLVPSTSMELIVLFEMLTVPESKNAPQESQRIKDVVLSSIIATPRSCRLFATTSLNQLSSLLSNVSWPILEAIVQCPPFRQALPELANHLTVLVEEDRHIWGGKSTRYGPSDTATALLTVPFDRHRDSRNNYKSRDASALYQNREERRDAFLYQLRSFLSIRGRVLDVVQASKMLESVQAESRNVLNGVLSANMAWFTQFFCDLLLQIGLVPLEETDKDLLKIADRETLQKLHRRFSSKESNATRKSRKPVLLKSAETGNTPTDEAQLLFTGYQEFFYMFIMSTNAYTFGIHLRRRISGLLVEMTARQLTTAHDVDAYIAQSQLLAKFLGVMVFSTNWQKAEVDQLPPLTDSACKDAIEELAEMGLNLRQIVENAWRQRHLLTTIPWIVTLLQMAKWDRSTVKSKSFCLLLSWLRTVQISTQLTGTTKPSNGQLVSFFLETYFGSVLGLASSFRLPLVALPKAIASDDADVAGSLFVDDWNVVLSNLVLFSASPPFEEMMALLNNLSREKAPGSVSVTKKLRPFGISQHARDPQEHGAESSGDLLRRPDITWNDEKTSRIQFKLEDAFFHQHKELKEICLMASNRILAKLTAKVVETSPFLHVSGALTLEDSKIESLIGSYFVFMQTSLTEGVTQAVDLLAPHGTPQKVLALATTLAVSNAMRIGEANVRSQLAAEWRKTLNNRDKKKLKVLSEKDGSYPMESATVSLMQLKDAVFSIGQATELQQLNTAAEETIAFFESWNDFDIDIPPEPLLRSFYESVFAVDNCIATFLACNLHSTQDQSRSIFLLLKVATTLSCKTKRGLKKVLKFLNTKNNTAFVLNSVFGTTFDLDASSDKITQASSLLADLVTSKLVAIKDLERVLAPLEESHWRKALCRELICLLKTKDGIRHALIGSNILTALSEAEVESSHHVM